uniref:Uncharacterized protein n=1 Tax=Anopheles culicifacies TaxID=139723 RepID=A0A182M8V6_9DIPT
MIIITGSTSNGDGDLPTSTSEDDEQHQMEQFGYGARNGSVGTMEEGTSLELSPVVEGVPLDEEEEEEEETEDSADISGGDISTEDPQLANGATYQLDLDQKCTSDDEDSLLIDGKLRNLISFCNSIVIHKKENCELDLLSPYGLTDETTTTANTESHKPSRLDFPRGRSISCHDLDQLVITSPETVECAV